MSLVQQRLKRALSLQTLFEQPVLRDLSQALEEAQHNSQTPIMLADRSQPLPLSWAQQRLWFIAQLEGGNAAYHIPGSVRLDGELSRSALDHALNTIVTRHEALRTVFKESDGEVWQVIVAPEEAEFTLQYCDLRNVEDQDTLIRCMRPTVRVMVRAISTRYHRCQSNMRTTRCGSVASCLVTC